MRQRRRAMANSDDATQSSDQRRCAFKRPCAKRCATRWRAMSGFSSWARTWRCWRRVRRYPRSDAGIQRAARIGYADFGIGFSGSCRRSRDQRHAPGGRNSIFRSFAASDGSTRQPRGALSLYDRRARFGVRWSCATNSPRAPAAGRAIRAAITARSFIFRD